jgi:hypothetical protein
MTPTLNPAILNEFSPSEEFPSNPFTDSPNKPLCAGQSPPTPPLADIALPCQSPPTPPLADIALPEGAVSSEGPEGALSSDANIHRVDANGKEYSLSSEDQVVNSLIPPVEGLADNANAEADALSLIEETVAACGGDDFPVDFGDQNMQSNEFADTGDDRGRSPDGMDFDGNDGDGDDGGMDFNQTLKFGNTLKFGLGDALRDALSGGDDEELPDENDEDVEDSQIRRTRENAAGADTCNDNDGGNDAANLDYKFSNDVDDDDDEDGIDFLSRTRGDSESPPGSRTCGLLHTSPPPATSEGSYTSTLPAAGNGMGTLSNLMDDISTGDLFRKPKDLRLPADVAQHNLQSKVL